MMMLYVLSQTRTTYSHSKYKKQWPIKGSKTYIFGTLDWLSNVSDWQVMTKKLIIYL